MKEGALVWKEKVTHKHTQRSFSERKMVQIRRKKIKVETEREERPEAEVLATEMGVLVLPLVVVAALLPLVVVAELAAALPPKNKNHISICAAAGGGSTASTFRNE